MHLLIDGYNLLHQTPWTGRDWQAARQTLLQALAAYRARRGYAITVVFDGAKGGWPTEQRTVEQGVTVIYTRQETEADGVIRREVARHPRPCCVVTSDRAVATSCKAHGAQVVTSEEFAARLGEAIAPRRTVQRGISKMDEGEEIVPHVGTRKRGNPRRLSKVERRKRQVLGKL